MFVILVGPIDLILFEYQKTLHMEILTLVACADERIVSNKKIRKNTLVQTGTTSKFVRLYTGPIRNKTRE